MEALQVLIARMRQSVDERVQIDLHKLTLDELRVLLKAVERGAIELPPEQEEHAKEVVIEGTASATSE